MPQATRAHHAAASCYRSMLEKERAAHRGYGIQEEAACHSRVRIAFVEWVLDVCEELELTLSTASTAVLYADRVLSNVKVPTKSLLLVGACCVLIAAKFEEPEARVPTLKKLHESVIDIYSVELMRKMELAILTELKWELSCVTPAHFVDYLLTAVGTHGLGTDLPSHTSMDHVRRYAMVLLSLSLQHMEFTVRYLPSVVAAAVLAATRAKVGCASRWTQGLADATGYAEADVAACANRLLDVYAVTFDNAPTASEERGALGSDRTPTPADTVRASFGLLQIQAAARLSEKERESTPSPKGPFDLPEAM